MSTPIDAVESVEQDPNTMSENLDTTQKNEETQSNSSDHDPPKTPTLDTLNPQKSDPQDPAPERDEIQDNPDDMVTEITPDQSFATASAANANATAPAPATTTTNTTSAPATSSVSISMSTTSTRRVPHRLQKRLAAVEKKSLKKLQSLNETLKPIPFTPPVKRNLDFSRQEPLLRRLGLWEFIHLEFDQNIRTDLLNQLIATYNPSSRCSYVNGARIGVNRADLARALKLPVKKDKINVNVNAPDGDDRDEKESQESIEFIEEIVSNWMLLHDDATIMPSDTSNLMKVIKEGNFEKMDWAGLIWCMVEKELSAPQLRNCYYASHMQCLIKSQREDILRAVEVKVADEVKEEDEEDCDGDVRMLEQSEIPKAADMEEHKLELSLGQDNVIDLKENDKEEEKEVDGNEDVIGFEGNKNEELNDWFLDGKMNVGENGENENIFRSSLGDDAKSIDCEDEKQEAEEGGEEEDEGEEEQEEEEYEEDGEEGFGLSPKIGGLERSSSANLIQGMEAMQVPFNTGVDICDNNLTGDFLATRVDANAIGSGLSSHFGNGNKRQIDQEAEGSHQSLHLGNKRLRSVESWENKNELDFCMDQVQHWVGKARMIHAEKEQACEQSNMDNQMLVNEIQKRDDLIAHLDKARMDEQQKRQMEVYRLERELYFMGNILDGYRNALKQTRQAFAQYRDRSPKAEEPLYKDVKGGEGLVLTTTEIEKLRQEEERMNRAMAEKHIKEFELDWIGKFKAHEDGMNAISCRFFDVESKFLALKKSVANKKASEDGVNAMSCESLDVESNVQAVTKKNSSEEGVTAMSYGLLDVESNVQAVADMESNVSEPTPTPTPNE